MSRLCSAARNPAAANRSGAQNTICASPERIRESASRLACSPTVAASITERCPASSNRRCWSTISATSGLTTTVSDSDAIAGSW